MITQSQAINRDSYQSLQQTVPTIKTRIKCVDFIRGIIVFFLLLVQNQPEVGFSQFQHKSWAGLTLTDVIFPSFMFISGISIPLAIKNNANPRKIGIRCCFLFGMGIIFNFFDREFTFARLQIMGPLQRITICYLIVVIIHVLTKYGKKQNIKYGIMLMMIFLQIYTAFVLTYDSPENDCPKGDNMRHYCFFRYIEDKIFGKNHSENPEGLFGTTTAVLTTYIGYYFGLLLVEHKQNKKQLIKQWTVVTVYLAILSLPVSVYFQIVTRLCTPTYVFVNGAIDGALMIFGLVLIDLIMEKNLENKIGKTIQFVVRPFLWLGMNSLTMYILSELIKLILRHIYIDGQGKNHDVRYLIYKTLFKSWIVDQNWSVTLFALSVQLFWILVAYIMFRNKIFIKL